jgi:hypothetical protein
MFQYTNTIVLNSLTDDTTGLDKLVTTTSKTQLLKSDGTFYDKGQIGLTIRRVNTFYKPFVCNIFEHDATDPVKAQATVTIATAAAGVYRLYIYMRLTQNQNSYYSNDMVFKGKPFAYEFSATASSTVTDMAAACVKAITGVQALYGDKYFTASNAAGVITIDCLDEHQIITEIKLQKLTDATTDNPTNSVFEDVVKGVIVKQGKPGFGTYNYLLENLRLPTAENRRWMAVNTEELPVPGAKYNEFILEYEKPRGVMGSDVVGDTTISRTTHVFYVLSTLSADFKTKLATIGTVSTVAEDGTITTPISGEG